MNRLIPALLALVVGGLVGFAAGAFFTGEDGDPDLDPGSGSSRGTRSSGGGAVLEEVVRSGATARRVEAPVIEVAEGPLRQLLAAGQRPTAAPGQGEITGTIVDEAGDPVPGVVIVATPARDEESDQEPWRAGDGRPPEQSLQEQVARFLAQDQRRELLEREARTDAEGRYRLDGISTAAYRVQAYLADHEVKPRGGKSWSARDGARIDFVVRPIVRVPVRVVFAGGPPPSDSQLVVSENEHNRKMEQWNPTRPELRLTPGTYKVSAIAGADEELASATIPLVLTEGQIADEILLELEPRLGIKGRIIVPARQESGGMSLHWIRLTGAVPDASELKQKGKQEWLGPHDGYEFFIKDIAPGPYYLGIIFGSGEVLTSATVTVVDGLVRQDLEIPAPQREDYIAVLALGPDGNPVRDTTARAKAELSEGGRIDRAWYGGGTTVRQRDGSVWIAKPRAKDDATIPSFEVTVDSKGYGKKSASCPNGPEARVTIAFDPVATLVVTVAGYVGSGFEEKLQVRLAGDESGEMQFRGMFVNGEQGSGLDAEGRRTFGPLQPGSYRIVLSLKTSQWQFSSIDETPVSIRSGESSMVIRIPSLYTVTVNAAAGLAGKPAQLRPVESRSGYWGERKDVGADGRVTFENLRAGEYRFSLAGSSMNVSLPGPAVVDFVAQIENAFRVTIDRDDGELAKAGLKTGDLVIGLNGTIFENEQQMRLLMGALMATEGAATIPLTVQRGAKSIEIMVPPGKLALQGRELGGRLDPTSR